MAKPSVATEQRDRKGGLTRRTFLGTLGSGALAASAPSVLGPGVAGAHPRGPRRFVIREDRFGRMFPGLRPFAEPSPRLLDALREVGARGGVLDAKDDLAAGPIALIVDPALSANNPNNPAQTAGTTFVGQFMDHDMTFDASSRLGVPAEPGESSNERTPAFDLDSVYGLGPRMDRGLYEPVDGRKGDISPRLRIEHGGLYEDLPREADGTAIIADPRNDENLMIAGLQGAVILFHNRLVDLLAGDRRHESPRELYRKARQLTTWHYQWMIVHEILPHFVGPALVDDVLHNGRALYRPEVGYIPVEFQGAAYRFGHSLVRPSYRANLHGDVDAAGAPAPFFGLVFDPAGELQADPVDLRGGCRARRRFIGWQTFFDFGAEPRPGGASGTLGEDVRPNKRIDTRISTPLFDLPLAAIASGQPPTSLPQRNLLRHITWGLPSCQSIARHMDVPVL
jgi:hypothetical protein